VKNVKVVDNKVIVEAWLWDGGVKDIDIGLYKLPPVYGVYRRNYTYDNLWLPDLIQNKQWENNIVDVKNGVFQEWSDIVENDFIRSIPDDAVVITDNAALKAIPSLANKKILNIDKDIIADQEKNSSLELAYYAKKISTNPSKVFIYRPACTDHQSWGQWLRNADSEDAAKWAALLEKWLKGIFPESIVIVTDNPNDLNNATDPNCIKVVDRHVLREPEAELRDIDVRLDKQVLRLPLDENNTWDRDEYKKLFDHRLADKLKQRNS